MKVIVLAIGKLKSRPIQELVAGYSERLAHYLPIEICSCRNEKDAFSRIEPQDFLVVLDERGSQKGSRELADFISEHQVRGTKHMVFFIGGEEGHSGEARARADLTLGLSRMTLPHELTQVILLEQIYRACSIIRGEPYHRG